jgi:hypothetical protein
MLGFASKNMNFLFLKSDLTEVDFLFDVLIPPALFFQDWINILFPGSAFW